MACNFCNKQNIHVDIKSILTNRHAIYIYKIDLGSTRSAHAHIHIIQNNALYTWIPPPLPQENSKLMNSHSKFTKKKPTPTPHPR